MVVLLFVHLPACLQHLIFGIVKAQNVNDSLLMFFFIDLLIVFNIVL